MSDELNYITLDILMWQQFLFSLDLLDASIDRNHFLCDTRFLDLFINANIEYKTHMSFAYVPLVLAIPFNRQTDKPKPQIHLKTNITTATPHLKATTAALPVD